jgi:5'-nucleotidase/UDP-sugar diphosphatase
MISAQKFFFLTIGPFFIIAGLMFSAGAENLSSIRVTLLFFNDFHGYLMPHAVKTEHGQDEVGGVARLATLVKRIESENRTEGIKTFVMIAGDILQGTPMSTVFRGVPDIECFNAMGVDVMTVGNHEFDFGLPVFLNIKERAHFPFISANIVYKSNGHRLCEPSVSMPVTRDVDLTFIGVTTGQLLTTTRPQNVAALDALDPVKSVKAIYEKVKDRGPVILLSHCRHQTDRAMARALPGLAAIIGGHDHILLKPYRKAGPVPIFQAFEKGRYLGRVDLTIDLKTKKASLISSSYIPVNARILDDIEVSNIVASYHNRLDERFAEVIGRSAVVLDGERDRIRYQETNLGNFVTDIMRLNTGAQIALLNAGSLRASIDKGPITVSDVFHAMPYANEIVYLHLSGQEVERMLTRSVSKTREEEDGGFLHVSGIRFSIRGHTVKNIRLGSEGVSLDPAKSYRVAVTDFLAAGGDGYALLAGKPAEYSGLPLRELIVDTIREQKVVRAQIDNRMMRLDEN